jgi:hypothetical protein
MKKNIIVLHNRYSRLSRELVSSLDLTQYLVVDAYNDNNPPLPGMMSGKEYVIEHKGTIRVSNNHTANLVIKIPAYYDAVFNVNIPEEEKIIPVENKDDFDEQIILAQGLIEKAKNSPPKLLEITYDKKP